MMKYIFGFLGAMCMMLIFGIVGGVDAGNITLGQAILWCGLLFCATAGCWYICEQ